MSMIEKVALAAWARYCTPDDAEPDDEMDEGQTYRQYAEARWKESPEGCTHIGADGFRDCARAAIEAMREPTDAIERAMAGSRAKDDEGIFERLADQLDYSGENKMWTVVRQAWRDGIDAALSQSGDS